MFQIFLDALMLAARVGPINDPSRRYRAGDAGRKYRR